MHIKFVQNVREVFVNVFVRYGSGAERWRPLTEKKWWNAACWTLIVIGIIGWVLFLFWPY